MWAFHFTSQLLVIWKKQVWSIHHQCVKPLLSQQPIPDHNSYKNQCNLLTSSLQLNFSLSLFLLEMIAFCEYVNNYFEAPWDTDIEKKLIRIKIKSFLLFFWLFEENLVFKEILLFHVTYCHMTKIFAFLWKCKLIPDAMWWFLANACATFQYWSRILRKE